MFKEYTRIFRFIKPHIGILLLAIFSMFISSLMGGVSIGMLIPFVDKVITGKQIALASGVHLPAFLNDIVNKINAKDSLPLLNLIVAVLVTAFLIKQTFEYIKTILMNEVGFRFLRDIRDALYKNMLSLSMGFFHKNPTGKLTSKILFDTAVIRDALIEGLTDIFYQPIEIIVYLCLIIIVKVYFAIPVGLLIMSIALTLIIIYPVVRIGRLVRKITRQTQEKVADINTTIFETITGISIVNAFSMQDYEVNKLKKQNHQYYKISMKSVERISLINPITELIALVCLVIVVWVGVRSVLRNNLSAGALFAFVGALVSLLKPLKRLSKVYATNQQALAAASRVFEIIDAKPMVFDRSGAVDLADFRDSIVCENIHFGYDDDQEVLKNITIAIKKGEIAAFVGPSGAGKTTLVKLFPRFYDPQSGTIKIDGVDIKDVSLNSLRGLIGMVTQDTILFNDTVAQNIAYGRDVKDHMDGVINAAKAANCHNFIMNMPQGYDTFIGERGFRVSGGEKQRLCIARAIFKNPPILILDEATSQLDTESELLVQEAIDRLMSGRTVLVIAHRLSTIKHADRIYVLEEGSIAETGSHDELMSRSGLYKRLYNLQFKLA